MFTGKIAYKTFPSKNIGIFGQFVLNIYKATLLLHEMHLLIKENDTSTISLELHKQYTLLVQFD